MAECRSCGKEIPEGMLYCSECETRMKADESYLDSLLSSVVANSVESAPERPVRKTTAEPVSSNFVSKEEPEAEKENFVIEPLYDLQGETETAAENDEPSIETVTDFDGDLTEAVPVEISEDVYDEVQDSFTDETLPESQDYFAEEIVPESQDYFTEEMIQENQEIFADEAIQEGQDFFVDEAIQERQDFFVDDTIQENRYDIFSDTDDSFLDDLFEDTVAEETDNGKMPLSSEDEFLADLLRSVDENEDAFDLEAMRADAAAYDAVLPEVNVPEDGTDAVAYSMDEITDQATTEEASVASVFDSYDEALDAEAALLGAALAEEVFANGDITDAEEGLVSDNNAPIPNVAVDEDFFSMLTAQEPEELPMDEDPLAMLGFAGTPAGTADNFGAGEADSDMMDIWGMMNSDTMETADNSSAAEFGDFPELFGTDDGLMEIPEVVAEENKDEEVTKKQKKKKKNIFKRIFGNVREDLTDDEIEERKRVALEKFEEDEQKAADDAAREKLHKEQRAKLKEEEAAKKQAEKEALAKKKAEDKRLKAEQKKLLKDKKEQAKRALLAEIEENEGKINKFGASIIIIMFAAMLCLITIGTSYYNYKISIDKAQFDFDLQRYDDAYNDVYGLEIKEEDMELYDKIMTVQYVNVQLLSYMRYHSLDMDAEALDSLIKGLRRYEKFIQHGTELGVKEDLNYLKTQIVEQLDSVFGINEATAYKMLALETQEEYSVQIYDIVSKKN